MVRHIVMWNLLDQAEGCSKEENIQKMQKGFRNLLGKIDGLTAIDVQPNFTEGGMDACLICEFTTREALEQYRVHPLHKEMQAFVHKVITSRVAHDCEI